MYGQIVRDTFVFRIVSHTKRYAHRFAAFRQPMSAAIRRSTRPIARSRSTTRCRAVNLLGRVTIIQDWNVRAGASRRANVDIPETLPTVRANCWDVLAELDVFISALFTRSLKGGINNEANVGVLETSLAVYIRTDCPVRTISLLWRWKRTVAGWQTIHIS
jgi:hypothetical protein